MGTFVKLVKAIMPAGYRTTASGHSQWIKRGGYSGEKSISIAVGKAKKLGFQAAKSEDYSVPDGSTVRGEQYYFDGDGTSSGVNNMLYISMRYGATARDNSFNIELHAARLTQGEKH